MRNLFLALSTALLLVLSVTSLSAKPRVPQTVAPYTEEKDIVYHNGERCRLDIYYPTQLTNVPVVVWFHGGGLIGGNKYIPQELKDAGLVVVAANYTFMTRGADAATTPADQFVPISVCLDDAAACVAWVRHHIAEFHGDSTRIFVAGHSAGGYLTSMLGLDKKWLAAYGVDADSIRGYAPFSGQAITHYEHRAVNGIPPLQAVVDEFAPMTYLRADASPFLIISGDRELELFGRYEEQAFFWRLLRLTGHPDVSIYEMQGYDHGRMPAPAFYILRNFISRLSK